MEIVEVLVGVNRQIGSLINQTGSLSSKDANLLQARRKAPAAGRRPPGRRWTWPGRGDYRRESRISPNLDGARLYSGNRSCGADTTEEA